MNKNGFTLVELLAVIIILSLVMTIAVIKVDKNIKYANEFGNEMQISNIENSALIYVEDYRNNLSNIDTLKVDTITISILIDSGLIKEKDVDDIPTSNKVIVAEINGILKAKYVGDGSNVIFINGPKEISLYQNDSYTEMGAYAAVPETGLVELESTNISSNVDTSVKGEYEVTYSYSNATSVVRKVTIL